MLHNETIYSNSTSRHQNYLNKCSAGDPKDLSVSLSLVPPVGLLHGHPYRQIPELDRWPDLHTTTVQPAPAQLISPATPCSYIKPLLYLNYRQYTCPNLYSLGSPPDSYPYVFNQVKNYHSCTIFNFARVKIKLQTAYTFTYGSLNSVIFPNYR